MEAQFILGHAYFKNTQLPEAITSFGIVVDAGPGNKFENAKWHLALAFLQQGQKEKALELLDEIAQSGSAGYKKLALALQSQLNSWWRFLLF